MEMQHQLEEMQSQLERVRRRMGDADRPTSLRSQWGVLARLDDVRNIFARSGDTPLKRVGETGEGDA
jgi:hypothetical protein